MKYPNLPKGSLASVIAQIVHFGWDDFSLEDSIPESAKWNISYICACFLAQHTVTGGQGVECEAPLTYLRVAEEISFAKRLEAAEKLVALYGGQK